jgi:hypothetical protein
MQGSSDDEFRASGYRSMVQETEGTEAQGIVTVSPAISIFRLSV